MELIYLYLESEIFHPSAELNLSGNIRISKEQKVLSILEREEKIPRNFFGNHIANVSYIIGENGSGKTSLFRFLISELVSGNANKTSRFVAVFQKEMQPTEPLNEKLFVYSQGLAELSIDFSHELLEEPPTSIQFISYVPTVDIGRLESINQDNIGNWTNLSDIAMLRKDFEMYFSIDYRRILEKPFAEICDLIKTTDIKREVELIGNPIYKKFISPKYVSLSVLQPISIINQYLIIQSKENQYQNSDISLTYPYLSELYSILTIDKLHSLNKGQILILCVTLQIYLSKLQMIFYSINSTVADEIKTELEIQMPKAYQWIKSFFEYKEDTLRWLDSYKAQSGILSNDLYFYIASTKHLLESNTFQDFHAINEQCELVYQDDLGLIKTDELVTFSIIDNHGAFEAFIAWLTNLPSASRIMSFSYLNNSKEKYNLSSGEAFRIKLFSRLCSNQIWANLKNRNELNSFILILDEADLGLHPRWQQNFLSELMEIIDSLIKTNFAANPIIKAQVIIATHSPIFISDIPESNVVWLGKSPLQERNINRSGFAGNIFDLFNDNFFLNTSYIGKFAESKINSLINFLCQEPSQENNDAENWNETKARLVINMVKDDILRLSLERLFDEKYSKYKTNWIERRIEELQKLK